MDFCPCDPDTEGFDANCPWQREGFGHVKKCPLSGDPRPCLPGSLAEAHCYVQANPDWPEDGIPPTAIGGIDE